MTSTTEETREIVARVRDAYVGRAADGGRAPAALTDAIRRHTA